ncbi:HugZ family heme oxygenase [Helicobacter sp. 12S02634-8]|uniref:HugZ family heme oxygenase n=1 Tax=Helicobacter sp. 12S02634-8 TaxID=1476199 RepID=UPI000BA5FA06|nr:HugZ family heme oxygenase [Helicobacter sp. 12S02634-8]PAF46360.1 HugZ family heme oxygenase [Helicobacter sp. 12S02634-8]
MEFQSIITHMNDHHQLELIGLLKKFGQIHSPQDTKLLSVDALGMDIGYDGSKSLRIEFPQKVSDGNMREGLKNAIIEMCQSIPKTLDIQAVQKDIEAFINACGSVIISSVHASGEVVCSYAPLLRGNGKYYIYISEVSEHYESLRANPKNVEVMFLEDESKAKSVILRKRLRYKTEVTFIERGEEFENVFDNFVADNGGAGGIKTIRNMMDFHLVGLEFKKGRFVKGFGQAYDIIDGKISYIGGDGNPHKIKK